MSTNIKFTFLIFIILFSCSKHYEDTILVLCPQKVGMSASARSIIKKLNKNCFLKKRGYAENVNDSLKRGLKNSLSLNNHSYTNQKDLLDSWKYYNYSSLASINIATLLRDSLVSHNKKTRVKVLKVKSTFDKLMLEKFTVKNPCKAVILISKARYIKKPNIVLIDGVEEYKINEDINELFNVAIYDLNDNTIKPIIEKDTTIKEFIVAKKYKTGNTIFTHYPKNTKALVKYFTKK
jgi:hypothetical protein